MNRAKTMLMVPMLMAGVAGNAVRHEGLGARQGRDIRHVARR